MKLGDSSNENGYLKELNLWKNEIFNFFKI